MVGSYGDSLLIVYQYIGYIQIKSGKKNDEVWLLITCNGVLALPQLFVKNENYLCKIYNNF